MNTSIVDDAKTPMPEHTNIQTFTLDEKVDKPESERHMGILKYIVFVILEASFAALVWYCWDFPRKLPYVYYTSSSIKSLFQSIFNLWHDVAIIMAVSICAESFSREWLASGSPVDEVSTITSGILSRIDHLWSRKATKTFFVAFAASIILTIMRITSPSTITLSAGILIEVPLDIALLPTVNASFSLSEIETPSDQGFGENLYRASVIVGLEKSPGGSPWGLSPEPNHLIPLPYPSNVDDRVQYNTDVALFQHSCRWEEQFRFSNSSAEDRRYVYTGSQVWLMDEYRFYEDFFMNTLPSQARAGNGSTIMQLWPQDTVQDHNGMSAYLFFGGNSTYPVNPTVPAGTWIDLSGLPTHYHLPSFNLFHPSSSRIDFVTSPLASILICEPNVELTSGVAKIEPTIDAQPDITVLKVGEVGRIGNIEAGATQALFSIALSFASNALEAYDAHELSDHNNFNSIVAQMFFEPTVNWRNSSGVPPKPLVRINDSIDDYMLAALKAFTSGNRPHSVLAEINGTYTKTVLASSSTDRLTMTTSHQYAILHVLLVTIEMILLLILVILNRREKNSRFRFENVRKYIVENQAGVRK